MATRGLPAQILVAKFANHLPFYRQECIYWSRHQVWLPRQTMVRWVELSADRFEPIYEEVRREVFSNGCVQVDEIPVRHLDRGHGKARQGHWWTTYKPRETLFIFGRRDGRRPDLNAWWPRSLRE